MKSSFSKQFGIRKKVNLTIGLIVAIVVVVTFAFLVKTQKLSFRAVPALQTVSVSGNVTDIDSGSLVPGATITIISGNARTNVVTTTTDNFGSYSANININPADIPNTVIIKEKVAGYFEDELERDAWPMSGITQADFKVPKIPPDVVSTRPLDPVSARCRTSPASYDYPLEFYHTGDYDGRIIDGVLFCVSTQNTVFFTTYAEDIQKNAAQINALVARTGLPFTPTIYLTGTITWVKGAGAYTPAGAKEIIEAVSESSDLSTITHEFGHLVDWWKGPDLANTAPYRWFCLENIAKTATHCFSSDRFAYNGFQYAASIARQGLIIGYAATNRHEMFAEMFTSQQTPDSDGDANFTKREHARYNIRNAQMQFQFLTGSWGDSFGASSVMALPTFANEKQNAAMYVYKFVASEGNLDQYFPGTIGNWTYNQIWYGKFMNTAYTSIIVVNAMKQGIANAPVNVGNIGGTTLLKKTSGVFADGGGDLFDTTGTLTLPNLPTGNTTFTYLGSPTYTTTLVQGANNIIILIDPNRHPTPTPTPTPIDI